MMESITLAEARQRAKVNGSGMAPHPGRKLTPIDLGTFLARDIPLRKMRLAPVLPTQGLLMVYARRGVGKTFTALNMAYAISSGG